jgi:hypothetical protein
LGSLKSTLFWFCFDTHEKRLKEPTTHAICLPPPSQQAVAAKSHFNHEETKYFHLEEKNYFLLQPAGGLKSP